MVIPWLRSLLSARDGSESSKGRLVEDAEVTDSEDRLPRRARLGDLKGAKAAIAVYIPGNSKPWGLSPRATSAFCVQISE